MRILNPEGSRPSGRSPPCAQGLARLETKRWENGRSAFFYSNSIEASYSLSEPVPPSPSRAAHTCARAKATAARSSGGVTWLGTSQYNAQAYNPKANPTPSQKLRWDLRLHPSSRTVCTRFSPLVHNVLIMSLYLAYHDANTEEPFGVSQG